MTQAFKDPWVLLGVDRQAADLDIKKAYRVLAKRYHPDRNRGVPGAEERFQEIANAYESIKNEDSRLKWFAENGGGVPSPDASQFPDLDEEMAQGPPGPRTALLEHELKISFQQAFTGYKTEVDIETEEACEVCGGSGAAPGHRPRSCELCRGSGEHKAGRVVNKCSGCNGEGFIIDKPCPACKRGKVKQTRPFILRIPAGVPDGYQMRIETGGAHSTVIGVTVEVEPSPIFMRNLQDPSDLMIEVPVSYSEAVLGAQVKIPTPTKVIALKIPPGTHSGKPFRISGEGMPKMNLERARGNLYAQAQIVVPESLTPQQKQLIEQLHETEGGDLRHSLFVPAASNSQTTV